MLFITFWFLVLEHYLSSCMCSVIPFTAGYAAAPAPEYRWRFAGSRSGDACDAAAAGLWSAAAAVSAAASAADAGSTDATST